MRFARCANPLRLGRWAAQTLAVSGWILMGAQCGDQNQEAPLPAPAAVTFSIDPDLSAPGVPPTAESGTMEKPVGLLVGPDGVTEGFILDEIIIKAETPEELNAFLEKYDGTVLHDGSVSDLPADQKVRDVPRASWYLVQVTLSRSSLDDFAANVEAAGLQGHVTFSSEDAARLMAIVAREASQGVQSNLLLTLDSRLEHPCAGNFPIVCTSSGAGDPETFHLDPDKWPWMSEDDDPNTAGDQGFSTGVTHAWDLLAYKDVITAPLGPDSIAFRPVRVAVIDVGFDLDPVSGVPRFGNLDYFNSLSPPLQRNVGLLGILRPDRAGGPYSGSSKWHGQESFGVCCARSDNKFGGAGTGGPVAQPILIRSPVTLNGMANGIFTATEMGAGVITISMHVDCGFGCELADTFKDDQSGEAVSAATGLGVVVLAGAGNDENNLRDHRILPCEFGDVICVGSVLPSSPGTNEVLTRGNFGLNVDISAPEGVSPTAGIFSTITEDALNRMGDNDNLANTLNNREDEVARHNGTSAATPFVAGVVALMKAVDPSLTTEQVRRILQETANHFPPPADMEDRIPKGVVDAYRAVEAVLPPNLPPAVRITSPSVGAATGWQNRPRLEVEFSDPEVDPADTTKLHRFPAKVIYESSPDGLLCSSTTPPSYSCESVRPQLSLGAHVITATATDAFGSTVTNEIFIIVVNRAPTADILKPLATDALFSHIPVYFEGFAPDPDELILDENMTWTSSQDGLLGTGRQLTASLTAGGHTIRLTAIDGQGLSATDQVEISVKSGAGLPRPKIVAVQDANGVSVDSIGPGQVITLIGEANDAEDGMLSDTSLEWSSDIDGVLGTGASIQATLSGPPVPCNPESIVHTITLKATDSDGNVATVTIAIRVGTFC